MKLWEKKLQNGLMVAVGGLDWVRLWRNNVGRARPLHDQKSVVQYGRPGMADIFGILQGGRFISIECKSPTGRLSEEQGSWARMCNKFGAVHIAARLPKWTTDERLDEAIAEVIDYVVTILCDARGEQL